MCINIFYIKKTICRIILTSLCVTTVVLIDFIKNHSNWERNVCLKIKICKCLISNLTNMSDFQPIEIVGCGSETQSQVGDNLNYLT